MSAHHGSYRCLEGCLDDRGNSLDYRLYSTLSKFLNAELKGVTLVR